MLGEKEHELANQNEYNFDHPDAFDFKLLVNTLQRLKRGKKVEVPIYNFVSHSRDKKTVSFVTPAVQLGLWKNCLLLVQYDPVKRRQLSQ